MEIKVKCPTPHQCTHVNKIEYSCGCWMCMDCAYLYMCSRSNCGCSNIQINQLMDKEIFFNTSDKKTKKFVIK